MGYKRTVVIEGSMLAVQSFGSQTQMIAKYDSFSTDGSLADIIPVTNPFTKSPSE